MRTVKAAAVQMSPVNEAALAVARDLDTKIESLLETAAGYVAAR